MINFKSFSDHLSETCNCWKGYKRKPGTAPCAEGSCIKEGKRERIKDGSGERMRKPGSKGAPTADALKASQNEEIDLNEGIKSAYHNYMAKRSGAKADHAYDMGDEKQFQNHVDKAEYHRVKAGGKPTKINTDPDKKSLTYREEVEAQFDLIESVVEEMAILHNVDSEYVWEQLEELTDEQLLEYAVDARGHKSSTGGLTQKGRDAYNSKGANLQAPVTTPPSKLKKGSKAANRRKSFCARMGGMEGPMKKPNGEPSRKALALRKWNC